MWCLYTTMDTDPVTKHDAPLNCREKTLRPQFFFFFFFMEMKENSGTAEISGKRWNLNLIDRRKIMSSGRRNKKEKFMHVYSFCNRWCILWEKDRYCFVNVYDRYYKIVIGNKYTNIHGNNVYSLYTSVLYSILHFFFLFLRLVSFVFP